jgi:hypothetical protein
MLNLCAKCRSLVQLYVRKIGKSNSMQENEENKFLQKKNKECETLQNF